MSLLKPIACIVLCRKFRFIMKQMSEILHNKVLDLNSYVLERNELITQLQQMRHEEKIRRNCVEEKRNEYLEDPERKAYLTVYGTQNEKTEQWIVRSIREETNYWSNLEKILYNMETHFRRLSSELQFVEQEIRGRHPLKCALKDWYFVMEKIMFDMHDLESTASSNLYNLDGSMKMETFLSTMKRNDVYSEEFGEKMTSLTNAIVNFLLYVSETLRKSMRRSHDFQFVLNV